MITFILSLVSLFLGFAVYGKIVENIFQIDENREVPAIKKADNLDYVLMPT